MPQQTSMLPPDGEVGGFILGPDGLEEGYAVLEGGLISEIRQGAVSDPAMRAVLIPDLVNCHTHCADYGLEVPPGIGLADLVAPPDGLKHRYLREAPAEEIKSSMERFGRDSRASGSLTFMDFREGGAEGCRLLRSACPRAVVLGRPVSPEFDPEEIADILSVADGIGLPSISDMDRAYIESVADAAREARRPFAIHVSERFREDIDFVLSLDPSMIVHMCAATPSDLSKCAEAEVPIAICPRSNSFFGLRAPIRDMVDCGCEILLGTDNGMLCRPDMLAEASALMRLAESQNVDASTTWDVLGSCGKKILNRHTLNEVDSCGKCYAVLPCGMDADAALRGYAGGGLMLASSDKE